MATATVISATGEPVDVELPLVAGRALAANSRPVVLSSEDLAALRQVFGWGASVDLAFTAASAMSAAIAGTTIRIVAKTADCRVNIGVAPVAVATSTLVVAGREYFVAITNGHKVAAIRDATTNGVLNITVVG